MTKVAYLVWTNWREIRSGVSTFIRLIEPLAERKNLDFKIVEAHVRDDSVPEVTEVSEQEVTKATKKRDRLQVSRFTFRSLRLALGYLRCLLFDIRSLWKHRRDLRGRILVTNEFGCETFPIAMRVLFPFSRIIAICHTHPGMLNTAQNPVRRLVERFCSASVSDMVFNSLSLQKTWREKLSSLPSRQTVIPHGIPAPDFTVPVDYPEKEAGCIDFICIARFVYWKGHEQLLKAWKIVGERGAKSLERRSERGEYVNHEILEMARNEESKERRTKNEERRTKNEEPRAERLGMRLVLVGDGDEEERMKALADELGIGDSVVFMGAKEGGDLYCNGADVGILLSIEPEAFGLVLLEAMSRGKPMIASNMGGFTEIIVDGETGRLVDPMDAESVAKAIVSLAEDDALRERMGENLRKRWREFYSAERMLVDYVGVFDREGI